MISVVISCKSKTQQPSIKEKLAVDQSSTEVKFEQLPEEFKVFYLAFHTDSVFQMSSIFFPLEGLPNNADPEFIANEKYFWSPDQWVFQKEMIKDGKEYSCDYTNVSDILIEEVITEKEKGLKLIRRFAKAGSGWRLIYYAGMNKYTRKPN